MAKKKGRYSGMSYAALFFILFYVIERYTESLFFTAEQQSEHITITTFVLVMLACVSWYMGKRLSEKKKGNGR